MSRFVRPTVLHKWSIPNVVFLIGAELCENKLPYAGGRFGFLEEECLSVIEHCQQADSLLKRSIPTLGGGGLLWRSYHHFIKSMETILSIS